MIQSTPAYKTAIVGDTRRMLTRAVISIMDPDITFGTVDSSGAYQYSRPEQAHDKVFELERYASLEHNRWLLDGSFTPVPAAGAPGQIGVVTAPLSGADGTFSPAVWMEETFANVDILQAFSLYFSTDPQDGWPVDFTVEVKVQGVTHFTKTFTGNTRTQISLDGFTIHDPDAIRVTVTRWSLPGRRFRAAEILPGVYEEWDGNVVASFSLKHQGDVSCLSLPFGTCSLRMDNLDRRFEPRNKQGIFRSIEERQGIELYLGCELPEGGVEYKQLGIFYQHSGGWRTSDNGIVMQWDLVDIVGLLAGREFVPPAVLPTTLSGWAAALVSQLGTNFANRYTVDPAFADVALTATAADVTGQTCGDLLRYICMASGTWPRADAETGYLAIEPLWSQGNKVLLDNLEQYPVMAANDDVAAVIFTLNDGNNTQFIVAGNFTAASDTKSVQNPFLKTQEQALTAARQMISTFGGNRIELLGRGDPAGEIGDVDTIWLSESAATTARRIQQDLSISDGVLKGCTSILLQADGAALFQNRELFTASGTWTAPEGVTEVRAILVGRGGDGEDGDWGDYEADGANGADGIGGLVWAGMVSVIPNTTYDIEITDARSAFGLYSTENGQVYPYGYTDVASGESYARTGVPAPEPGSGGGGKGGKGGARGRRHQVTRHHKDGSTSYRWVIDKYPDPGEPGVPGVSGCVVLYYDKE